MPRFDWERVIRRADLPLSTKGVALLLASYADDKGRKVHPGEERLARVSGINARNVRRHVAKIRDLGLITRTSRANRKRGLADEYRLTVPVDLASLNLLDVDEAERIEPVDNSSYHRSTETGKDDLTTGQQRPEGVSEEGSSPVTGDAITGHTATDSPVTSDRPPTMHQPSTNTDDGVTQETKLSGDPAEPVDNEESSGQFAPLTPDECDGGHGGRPGRKTDGQPWCAQCRLAETGLRMIRGGRTA